MRGLLSNSLPRGISCMLVLCALLICLEGLCAGTFAAAPVVRLFVFTSPDCSHCAPVKEENLKAVAARVGCQLEYRFFDIREMANYQQLVDMEECYHDTDNEMPVVFIGKQVLGGSDELERQLEEVIRTSAAAGGVDWPDAVVPEGPAVPDNAKSPQIPATSLHPDPAKTVPKSMPPTDKDKPDSVAHPPPGGQSTTRLQTPKTIVEPKSTHAESPVRKPPYPPARVNRTANPPATAPRPRCYMAFFAAFGCRECQRVTYLLNYLRHMHPTLTIKEFDLHDRNNAILYEAVARRYRMPARNRLVPATTFIGDLYYQQDAITLRNLNRALARYEEKGTTCPWEVSARELDAARNSITHRFLTFGPLTVFAAGLLDGINPCAFTTLVFFISYLFYAGKRGKEILLIGSAFTLAIFLTYFLIGCGIFAFLKYLDRYAYLSQVLTWIIAGSAIVLGGISLFDYVKARRGRHQEIQLQLPGILKQHIHRTIRASMHTYVYTLTAFAAGVIISVLELACTGQVYLPTISFVTSQPELRAAAMAFLALYNLMFIIPLVVVFILAYRGRTSARLADWSKRHLAAVKLGTAVLFIGLGLFLLLNPRI